MMMTVYKYPFAADDDVTIEMPRGARVLTVQVQYGTPCLWAEVDPAQPTETRRFRVVGTGHPLGLGKDAGLPYVGTFQLHGGALVFHLFERSRG